METDDVRNPVWYNGQEREKQNGGTGMKRLVSGILFLVFLTGFIFGAFAEKNRMEEIIVNGPNGEIYGMLEMPAAEEALPLIILSHGFGGNHTFNQDYADYFVSRGFATYNLDFCGGGMGSKSSGTMMDMSVLTEAADLDAVIDTFREDPRFSCILLWGSSQGGFVSAYVSAQRPDDITAVVLEFPAIVLQDDSEERRREDGSFPETINIMGIKLSGKYDEDATSFDLYDLLPRYTGPVLILHGDKDPVVPLRYSERAAETYADAQLIVYPGQGHGFNGKSREDAKEAETAFFLEHAE